MTATPPLPPLDDVSIGTLVDAAAPLMGLAIDSAWRDGVIANVKASAAAARLVLDFPLDDTLEPAPIFSA